MRNEEENRKSFYGDNTDVLTKEFKLFAIKRFGEQISLFIISVNELKSKCTIFNKLTNKVMLNLFVFSSRMLNRIFRDIDGTSIVIINSETEFCFLLIQETRLLPI